MNRSLRSLRHRLLSAAAGLAATLAAFPAGALLSVDANVTTDTIWGDDAGEEEILLQTVVFVKDGATLTILPGVVVRGQPRTGPPLPGNPAGVPGALVVTRGSRIVADGNASAPIVFTTAAADNDDDGVADDFDGDTYKDAYPGFDPALSGAPPGTLPCTGGVNCVTDATPAFLDDTPLSAPLAPLDRDGFANTELWAGLVVLGQAATNHGNPEGLGLGADLFPGLAEPGFPPLDAAFGGLEENDDSGVLRYVSVRHGGAEIGDSNELNGITLAGVGHRTTVEYVEAYAGFDDGIEVLGGDVDIRYFVAVFNGDDHVDLDVGYEGVAQFGFVCMPFFNENDGSPFGFSSGDRGIEADGNDYLADSDDLTVRASIDLATVAGAPYPLGDVAIYNLTLIGSTPVASPDFVPVSTASANVGVTMRAGFAGDIHNSILLNTGAQPALDVSGSIGDSPTGYSTIDFVGAGTLRLVSSTLDDVPTPGGGSLALSVIGNGDTFAAANGGTANVVNAAAFPGLAEEDASFDPRGNAAGKLVSTLKPSPLDPRPVFGLVGTVGGTPAQRRGADSAVTYRGAFDRTAPVLWTTGWTVLNIAGLLAD